MWGKNEDGKQKKALIAWHEITRPRSEGGLDIRPFELQAKTLKMRHMTQLLEGRETEWTWIAQHFIEEALHRGKIKRNKV